MESAIQGASHQALRDARTKAQESGNVQVLPLHLAAALLDPSNTSTESLFRRAIGGTKSDADSFVRAVSRDIKNLPERAVSSDSPTLSPLLIEVLCTAARLRGEEHEEEIDQRHLIRALIRDESILSALAVANIFDVDLISDTIQKTSIPKSETSPPRGIHNPLFQTQVDWPAFTTDLLGTMKSDPVVGRDDEVDRILLVMARRAKNGVVLVGERGVGKTAVARALAKRLATETVLPRFSHCKVTSVKSSAQDKESLECLVKSSNPPSQTVVLFIDDVHHFLSVNKEATTLLESILARENFRCMIATTPTKYTHFIRDNDVLGSQFQQILIKESSVDETVSILTALKPRYEAYHNVRIYEDAIMTAAIVASKELPWRNLPESAVDLMDEAAASAVRLDKEEPEVLQTLLSKRLQLEESVKILTTSKDMRDVPKLEEAKSELNTTRSEILKLQRKYRETKQRREELLEAKMKMERLEAKLESATWKKDFSTVTDMAHYVIPYQRKYIEGLELKAREAGDGDGDIVSRSSIKAVASRWATDRKLQEAQAVRRKSKMKATNLTKESAVYEVPAPNAQSPEPSNPQDLETSAPSREPQHPFIVIIPETSEQEPSASQDQSLPTVIDQDHSVPTSKIQSFPSNVNEDRQPELSQKHLEPTSEPKIPKQVVSLLESPPSQPPPKTGPQLSEGAAKVRKRDKVRHSIGSMSSLFHHDKNLPKEKKDKSKLKALDATKHLNPEMSPQGLPAAKSITNKLSSHKRHSYKPIPEHTTVSEPQIQIQPNSIPKPAPKSPLKGLDAIKLLKANNFSPEKPNFQPEKALIWAAATNNPTVLTYLIQHHHASLNEFARMDALSAAATKNNADIIPRLLSHNFISPTRKYCYYKTSALHEIIKSTSIPTIEALISAGPDPLLVCANGRTALHEAAALGNVIALRFLLTYNPALSQQILNTVDMARQNALHIAARNAWPDAVRFLLGLVLDPAAKTVSGACALHLAAGAGNMEIVRMLLEADRALLTTADDQGQTPLHYAVDGGHAGVARALFEEGADPGVKDNSGRAPAVEAFRRGWDCFA